MKTGERPILPGDDAENAEKRRSFPEQIKSIVEEYRQLYGDMEKVYEDEYDKGMNIMLKQTWVIKSTEGQINYTFLVTIWVGDIESQNLEESMNKVHVLIGENAAIINLDIREATKIPNVFSGIFHARKLFGKLKKLVAFVTVGDIIKSHTADVATQRGSLDIFKRQINSKTFQKPSDAKGFLIARYGEQ